MRHHPGDLIDRYEILDSLGEGAYAETYKALDTRSGDTVVLKMPNPNLFADPGLFQRYRRESDIARKLDHPGVQRRRWQRLRLLRARMRRVLARRGRCLRH